MLYSCTHKATVGVKGIILITDSLTLRVLRATVYSGLTAVGLVRAVSAVVVSITQVVERNAHSVVTRDLSTLTVTWTRWSHRRTVYNINTT